MEGRWRGGGVGGEVEGGWRGGGGEVRGGEGGEVEGRWRGGEVEERWRESGGEVEVRWRDGLFQDLHVMFATGAMHQKLEPDTSHQ